ncbi:hypothetical protein LguiA_017631 [Lonicera macranthoides]
MLASRYCSQVDTIELKTRMERKIGQLKSRKYFSLLSSYLSLKLSKSEFSKHCIGLVGREAICLHNELLRGIIKNASIAKYPPPKPKKTEDSLSPKVPNGYYKGSLQSLCRDMYPRKGRTPNLRERKFKDRLCSLGSHGKTHNSSFQDLATKVQEQQSATELLSLGSRPPAEVNSVEEGEEVEQAGGSPGIYSRSPIRAPLGISINPKQTRKVLLNCSPPSLNADHTCRNICELPDTGSLKSRVDQKLETEGLETSMDCVNLLNNGLDILLKRMIKPCLELAGSRSRRYEDTSCLNGMQPLRNGQSPNRLFLGSMLDFRVAMELNPGILGEDWPVHLENICLRVSEKSVGSY